MPTDRFLIAPLNEGLQQNLKPWLISEQAFATLRNAFNWRGRVRKRWGAQYPEINNVLSSRLRIRIGTTDAGGNFVGDIPLSAPFTPHYQGQIGQWFSVEYTSGPATGSVIFTVNALGNPIAPLTTDPAITMLFATTVGSVAITGNATIALSDVYWYPGLPVMGFSLQESSSINNNATIAWDQVFAYKYLGSGWERLDLESTMAGESIWSGSDFQFFWSYNARGADPADYILYVSNNNPTDGLRYLDNTDTWYFYTPIVNSNTGDTILTARIIIAFQGRLLCINTVESTGSYVNRCRFTWLGDPLSASAWDTYIQGRGGFIDAPTKEAAITAQLFHNRLIVYFESSTYELVYTGNQVVPFYWQILNPELGAESTFSEVPFDEGILGVGNVGIHTSNGNTVQRIDNLIPDTVFSIHNGSNGVERVAGIRDYYFEMVWWTYPDGALNRTFPTNILGYNYKNGSWAIFDDSITAFGRFQRQTGLTWENANMTWDDADFSWNVPVLQSQFPNIICGNQEGFTFVLAYDIGRNSGALAISSITVSGSRLYGMVVINHNLSDGDYVLIENCAGSTELNGAIGNVSVTDANTITVYVPIVQTISTYAGAGTLARVSVIDIWTKQYNFYNKQGFNCAVNKIDFNIDAFDPGSISIELYPSFSTVLALNAEANSTGTQTGVRTLSLAPYPLVPEESYQDQLWHSMYMWAQGSTFQVRIFYTADILYLKPLATQMFVLNAMMFYVQKTSSRFE